MVRAYNAGSVRFSEINYNVQRAVRDNLIEIQINLRLVSSFQNSQETKYRSFEPKIIFQFLNGINFHLLKMILHVS